MAKKIKEVFVCSECGNEFPKWIGQCSACGAWNTLKAAMHLHSQRSQDHVAETSVRRDVQVLSLTTISSSTDVRLPSGISELDRVLGGIGSAVGFVKGSVVLLAGEPGIGKSTLLSQLLLSTLNQEVSALYVSGEESVSQVHMRLVRLSGKQGARFDTKVSILSDNNIENIIYEIRERKPDIVIVDSIQTMISASYEGSQGSVMQVRECSSQLIRVAKELQIVMLLVGHVTKEGAIAGPRLLEHMVDVVLWFEGDRQSDLRMLRGIKNRYGGTHEVGLFVMRENGLLPVENPSEIFLADRQLGVPGSVVTAVMEGTRPMLVEVQSLVVPTQLPMPRRVASGFDYNRLQTLIAVLIRQIGLKIDASDVYVNVVGGLSIDDPAADAAVCVAILSAVNKVPLAKEDVVFGEIGLLGELRSVRFGERRIDESLRLGYSRVLGPTLKGMKRDGYVGVSRLAEIVRLLGLQNKR